MLICLQTFFKTMFLLKFFLFKKKCFEALIGTTEFNWNHFISFPIPGLVNFK